MLSNGDDSERMKWLANRVPQDSGHFQFGRFTCYIESPEWFYMTHNDRRECYQQQNWSETYYFCSNKKIRWKLFSKYIIENVSFFEKSAKIIGWSAKTIGWSAKIMDRSAKIQKGTKNFELAQLCTTLTPWSEGVRQYTWAFLILKLTYLFDALKINFQFCFYHFAYSKSAKISKMSERWLATLFILS